MLKILMLCVLSFTVLFGYEALIDQEKKLTIYDVVKSKEFQNIHKERNSFGYGDFNVWIKKRIENKQSRDRKIVLEISPHYLENVTLFLPSRSMSKVSSFERFSYEIELKPKESIEAYIHIESRTNKSVEVKLFESIDSFRSSKNINIVFNQTILTIILMLFFVYFFINIFIRNLAFGYYLGYMLSIGIYFFFTRGIYLDYGVQISTNTLYASSVGINAILIFMLLFVKEMMRVEKGSLLNMTLNATLLIIVCNYFYLFVDYSKGSSFRGTILIPLVMVMIFLLLLSKVKTILYAKYLLLGWIFLMLGLVLRVMSYAGFIPNSIVTVDFFIAGIFMEMITFGLVLSYQLYLTKKNEARLILDQKNKECIIKEQAKFAQIGVVLANIEHEWRRPLNHLASISSRLQTHLYNNGGLDQKEIEKSLIDIDSSINEMHLSMEEFKKIYLPDEKKSYFDMRKIIEESIDYFEKVNGEKIEVAIECEVWYKLYSFPNSWRLIILNLLQNSFEAYQRRDKEEKRISILAHLNGRELVFSFSDDAGGVEDAERIFELFFSTKKEKSGIGLYMIKQSVEQNLLGKISAKNREEGLEIVIRCEVESEY